MIEASNYNYAMEYRSLHFDREMLSHGSAQLLLVVVVVAGVKQMTQLATATHDVLDE
jgi:hypothetical protein